MNPQIPFLDLRAQYRSIRHAISGAIQGVFDDGHFLGGPELSAFESEFAAYVGSRHAVALSSGTAALHLALRALGVGPGDEVITQPNTFVATAAAIALTGATPVFVDIERSGICPPLDAIVSAISPRTKAIVPVHLFGYAFPRIDELVAVADERGVAVVEDACQAHGTRWRGRPVGSFGRAGAFSFYPGKNLGAYGDAGALVTNETGLAHAVEALRNHGSRTKFRHDRIGSTERMDTLQAAVLRVKLPYLEGWNARRREIARIYSNALAGVDVDLWLPSDYDNGETQLPNFHLYVLRHPKVVALARHLEKRGIGTGRHYPVPCHRTSAFAYLKLPDGSFPHAEDACRTGISIPIYPELSDAQCERVANSILEFFRG